MLSRKSKYCSGDCQAAKAAFNGRRSCDAKTAVLWNTAGSIFPSNNELPTSRTFASLAFATASNFRRAGRRLLHRAMAIFHESEEHDR